MWPGEHVLYSCVDVDRGYDGLLLLQKSLFHLRKRSQEVVRYNHVEYRKLVFENACALILAKEIRTVVHSWQFIKVTSFKKQRYHDPQ